MLTCRAEHPKCVRLFISQRAVVDALAKTAGILLHNTSDLVPAYTGQLVTDQIGFVLSACSLSALSAVRGLLFVLRETERLELHQFRQLVMVAANSLAPASLPVQFVVYCFMASAL